ncbi:glycosyltransferase family 4 protein [Poseidonibacter sp.]|uniref:glycosyltransferase family 4 protein n=1 Tax=Poseidonibacter sp. TaxID=2321188 RepID=UPI003C741F3B
MKILILSNYYPPYYIGGYELACFDTVEYLKNAGHDVYVLTGDYKECSQNFQRVYRKLKYIDYSNPSFLDKFKIEEFNYNITKDVISKINPDLVYIWSLRLVSLAPLWAVEETKVKKVFEIGDFWMKGFLSNSFMSKIKRSIKQVIPFFKSVEVKIDPIISVSNWMKEEMKELYGSQQIFQIPNGTKITKEKVEKNSVMMRYMFCGRLDYSKGLDLAIKALSNLKDKKVQDFQFHIYGDGDKTYIKRCKQMIKILNLEDEVFFHGKCDNLEKEYKKNHVLLMPTRMREPFGLVLIEAMNYGVVCLATNDYGPAEIIDDKKNGLLFSALSVDDLTSKILLIHNNWNLLQKYREDAYIKVANKFDINIVKKEVENVLLNIARV